MAVYPAGFKSFSYKLDTDPAWLNMAEHVNALQDEVRAIEATIGVHPRGGYDTFKQRLDKARVVNEFGIPTPPYTTCYGRIRTAGLHRLIIKWVKIYHSKTPPSNTFFGFRLTANKVDIGGRYIDPFMPKTGRTPDGDYYDVQHDVHHLITLAQGDFVQATGVLFTGGVVYEPHIIARRLPS